MFNYIYNLIFGNSAEAIETADMLNTTVSLDAQNVDTEQYDDYYDYTNDFQDLNGDDLNGDIDYDNDI